MQPFSHHSSNPLEAGSSDCLNARYTRILKKTIAQHQRAVPEDYSPSSDPLSGYDAPDQHRHVREYQQHLAEVVPGLADATPKPKLIGASRSLMMHSKRHFVDLDDEMGSDDLLLQPFSKDHEVIDARTFLKIKQEEKEEEEEIVRDEQEEWADEVEEYIVVDEEDREEPSPDDETNPLLDEDQELANSTHQERAATPFSSPLSSLQSSPLTPLSGLSSPQSSRPPSPTESISRRPQDEQEEIRAEIAQIYASLPDLKEDYELVDRLGTGTFSSVYKAVDLKYEEWDNSPWLGHHPPESSAYYQSAGPGYKGRGGKGVVSKKGKGKGKAMDDGDTEMGVEEEAAEGGGKVYVAIKRIYTTSGPERIRNELAIMESCRGCRHISQIITAYRHLDQVVIVLPYQKNMDFRDFYPTLHPEGIKCYFRCLFKALRDIHARGIIHRDVKPANFLYNPYTGVGTLCDFGLASRMEYGQQLGMCYHTSASAQDPHGKNRILNEYETLEVKKAQREARAKSAMPAEKVGYPENDRRVASKANRAGTRGFRAPEVLLKCGAQTGAIDVWSAGIIMLFFLTNKFPIFQSGDDVKGFMEIAVIVGKKNIEKTATLHSRTLATNIPGLENEGISWREFVEKLNPSIWEPKEYDYRFYPHNSKHRDGRGSVITATPLAPSLLASGTDTTTEASSGSLLFSTDPPSGEAQERETQEREARLRHHTKELKQIFHLLEKIFHPESTKRATPRTVLYHQFLREPGTPSLAPGITTSDAHEHDNATEAGKGGDDDWIPRVPGEGVCEHLHHQDETTGRETVEVFRRCQCLGVDGAEWCGEWVREVRELVAGEGVAVGDMPCEFHRDMDEYESRLGY